MTDKRPQTANDVLRQVDEDHEWTHNPADNSTTPGIQRTLERHRVAIQRLADFIDGVYEEPAGEPVETWKPPAETIQAPDTVGP